MLINGSIELTEVGLVHRTNEVYHVDTRLSVGSSCISKQFRPIFLTSWSFQISQSPRFMSWFLERPKLEQNSFMSMRILAILSISALTLESRQLVR